MKTSRKMHRPTAVIAALLIILCDGMNAAALLFGNSQDPIYVVIILGAMNLLLPVLFVVLLFRGKKDVFAGVVFMFAVAISLFNVGWNALGLLANIFMQAHELNDYAISNIIGGIVIAAFMVLLAVECFIGGRISASRARVLLWLLPALVLGCKLWQMIPLYIQDGMKTGEILLSVFSAILPKRLSQILMGVSMSIPQEAENE